MTSSSASRSNIVYVKPSFSRSLHTAPLLPLRQRPAGDLDAHVMFVLCTVFVWGGGIVKRFAKGHLRASHKVGDDENLQGRPAMFAASAKYKTLEYNLQTEVNTRGATLQVGVAVWSSQKRDRLSETDGPMPCSSTGFVQIMLQRRVGRGCWATSPR